MSYAGFAALAVALIATPLAAQTPLPPPGPGPGNGAQPPPGQPDGPRDRRRPAELGWYNGDYAVDSIDAIVMIDDPVTGFGNESLWESPAAEIARSQSDIAASGAPD
ncbi:hypothetical protein HFP51_09035 [Parasphingopyxis sp. CP4]|uniref:hypothetical protein n=1 Tax=Parasphingopyxis sp. CP4 TaxID=2724527 RepID=UPI0015A07BF2|nr:hypothetical protein [Parasphingopyxis sp. CP4]QLC22309.1 hypothetical protein HFP51_09035 [Parasphingopyxis sp. CP4]